MKRRCLSILLVLCMVMTLLPTTAWAAESTSGTCGENLTWTLDDSGTLTISGTGPMTDYWLDNRPWVDRCGSIKHVIISNGVTSIGRYTFHSCNNLTSVTIGTSVTSIGWYAFSGCRSLTSIIIPDGVTSIGQQAFYGCEGLISVAIPNSVTSIEGNAFSGCSGLTSVIIPNSVTNIGYQTFYGCEGLTSVTIGNRVTNIGEGAFASCSGLTSITIPNSVTSIGRSAFEDCSGLTSVTIPDSVTSIGEEAFAGCSGLTSITLSDGVANIGDQAFWGCDALRNINIPGSVVSIGNYAFGDCNLSSVTINSGVTNIGNGAFSGCGWLTNVVIPDTITRIGSEAFWYCGRLTHVTIPSGVTNIGAAAFAGCEELMAIQVDSANQYYTDMDGVLTSKDGDTIIAYPGGKKGAYTIPNGVTIIGETAFSRCVNLTQVTIPDGVTDIKEYAFAGCSGLVSVIMPKSITNIEAGAFSGPLKDVYYSGDKNQWDAIKITKYHVNNPCNQDLINANIHYNSSGPDDIGSDNLNSVYFLSGWDATTRTVQFGDNTLTTPGKYIVADSVDVSSIDSLLNKYVLVTMEQGDSSLEYTITDIQPVESKIGTVSATGEHSLTIDGTAYPVREDFVLASHSGKEILYHISNGTIMGFDVLEERTGTLEAWDSATGRATIDGKEYPSNYVSSLTEIEELIGQKVQFQIVNETEYSPLLTVKLASNMPDEPITPDSDSYIVDRVKKYTSDVMYKQYENIMTSNDSDETKYQRLTELFSYYGILDVREGISYLSNTIPERYAYLALTTNEMYANYLAWDWLNFTSDGRGYRVLLLADGLTFNNELSTWVDPLTWVGAKDTPGVEKYKDMLYDFMDASSKEIEVLNYISLVKKLLKNTDDSAELYANRLIKQIEQCEDIDELSALLDSADAQGVFRALKVKDGTDNQLELGITLDTDTGFGKFSKAVGKADKALTIMTLSIQHIKNFIELDSKLAVYTQYTEFLDEIRFSTDLPWEMRVAATKIQEEIKSSVWNEVYDVAIDIIEQSNYLGLGEIKDEIFDICLDKIGCASFNEYLKVIKITSWCIDQVTDISGLVKGAAYMEGYAYLNMHYRNKLVNSKIAFLSDQTPENAWKFFENYNLLYQLRCKGEEATLKMFKLKELPVGTQGALVSIFGGYKNDEYETVVQQTLEMLEDCKFTLPDNITIPESVQYVTKSVISCPVDVEIYAPDGTYVTTLVDGRECDIANEYGRFAVVYRAYTGTYAKVICMSQNGNYTFKVIGQNDGLVNFELGTTLGNATEVYGFTNSLITQGATFEISTDKIINEQIYDIDADGDGVIDKTGMALKIDEASYAPVSNVALNVEKIILTKGGSFLLTVSITPENATRKNVVWVTDNKDVASIADGKIMANSTGTATIYCFSQDNPDVFASCIVTVETSSIGPYTIRFNANSGYVDISTATTEANGMLSSLPTPIRNGYIFDGWFTSASGGNKITTDYVFTSDTTVYAHWTKNSGGSSGGGSSSGGGPSGGGNSSSSYSITAGNSAHGSVSVSPKSASKGTRVTLTIQPDSGYELDSLVVKDTKGNAVELTKESNTKYTFTMPNSKVTIDAAFIEIERQTSGQISFTDVTSNAYYYDAVAWAVEQGITSGTSATTFSPDAPCTRAQIVTFLWRAAGSPVMGGENPFTDVASGSYYYDAVQWAVAQGITVGTSANTFNPDATCTRGQAVTFLYRYEKSPAVSGNNAFTDVSDNAYYTNAVQWAAMKGVTSGTSITTFSPDATCTRGQIVTFLYRDIA